MLHQLEMSHDVDPKTKLLEELGDISKINVYGNILVVATYKRPEKTKNGIILTDKYKEEDFYQGKVGLVIAKGPNCFRNDGQYDFAGQNVEVGDWVMYRTVEAPSFGLNGVHCRFLEDIHVRLRVPHPDMVF